MKFLFANTIYSNDLPRGIFNYNIKTSASSLQLILVLLIGRAATLELENPFSATLTLSLRASFHFFGANYACAHMPTDMVNTYSWVNMLQCTPALCVRAAWLSASLESLSNLFFYAVHLFPTHSYALL